MAISTNLKRALKLQESAQLLIRSGCVGADVNSKEGRAVIAWVSARRRFVQRRPATLVDGQILLHFAAQALGALPNAVTNGTSDEAELLASEASVAMSSLGTLLENITGKTPRDLGLYDTFFPETLN